MYVSESAVIMTVTHKLNHDHDAIFTVSWFDVVGQTC